jgi:hypothetical protein
MSTRFKAGTNAALARMVVGMTDVYTGLDLASFRVVADFAVDGVAAGQNLAARFRPKAPGVWEWSLSRPLTALPRGTLTVSVQDRQGNVMRVARTFAVGTMTR